MTTGPEPPTLEIDFCAGCEDAGTGRCDGCIRAHLNEELDYDEGYRDNHSLTRQHDGGD